MAKTYSDPELGRMPNVAQTGLNQAAAANKAVKAKVGSRNAAGMLPPTNKQSMMTPKLASAKMGSGPIGQPAQGNAQSSRMFAPMQMAGPAGRVAGKAIGKALGASKKAFNKMTMKGRGKKIPI